MQEGCTMPKFLYARPPCDEAEEHKICKLAGARHAPADWIRRAKMIVLSWAGVHTTAIADQLGCHPQTVRERLTRFNAEGLDGLGDQPIPGRPRRLTEADRSAIIALVGTPPPGRPWRHPDATLQATAPDEPARWTLDSLTQAAHVQGITVGCSQIRRILPAKGVPWPTTRSWAVSKDPAFGPKEQPSSGSTPPRRRRPPSSAATNSAR
jgi:transposase